MNRQVGRLTAAAALMGAGILLIADNLLDLSLTWYAARLSALMLIGLGMEWLWAIGRTRGGGLPRVDTGAVGAVVILWIAGSVYGHAHRPPWVMHAHMHPQAIPAAPRVEISPASLPSGASASSHSGPPGANIVPPVFLRQVRETVTIRHEDAGSGVQAVEIRSGAAGIEAVPGERFAVVMTVTGHGASGAEARTNANLARLRVEMGDVVKVWPELPPGDIASAVRLQVTLPPGVSATLRSTAGSVVVTGVASNLQVLTASGEIQVSGLKGSVRATGTSGAVSLDRIEGPVQVDTTTAAIRVTEAAGAITATSSSGSITVSAPRVGGAYDLSATSGSVRVALPRTGSAQVTARSTSGTVSGPHWLAIGEGRSSGSGRLGTGEYLIMIRTTSGSVIIDEL